MRTNLSRSWQKEKHTTEVDVVQRTRNAMGSGDDDDDSRVDARAEEQQTAGGARRTATEKDSDIQPPWEEESEDEEESAALGFVLVPEDEGADEAHRTVTVYENERYNALSRQWSSGALLPTDRRTFSNESGKRSWRELADVEAELAGVHWTWVEPSWKREAYEYAGDFGKRAFSGRETAGRFDFVRRRRITRRAKLCLIPGLSRCPRVDPAAEDAVLAKVRETLTTASLLTGDDVEDDAFVANAVEALDDLLEFLHLSGGGFGFGPTDADAGTAFTADLSRFLAAYTKKYGRRGLFGGADASATTSSTARRTERRDRLERLGAFRGARCAARAAVRRYDGSQGRGACDGRHFLDRDANCRLRSVACPNCGARVSRRGAREHDDSCDRKKVPCKACGSPCERRLTTIHRARDCPKRTVRCPFGCAQNITADQLAAHHDAATPGHSLLLLQRANDANERLKEHDDRLVDLEKRIVQAIDFSRNAEARLAEAATSIAAVKADLQAEIRAAADSTAKATTKQHKADLAKHTTAITALQKAVRALERTVGSLNRGHDSQESR
ncbi:hypothetical protein CTAYLR_003396 [Chrysophaeum taylorii]|uniref:TRAF-type domain-containing protein n=1 Tax=Chrysophaeum taylorii TaxID=2483200 RepID=A0AAD7XIL4_9STRA|nr:hypothetical protein CTAYLR_003396 [Chrysophaeum taylorii]